MPASPATGWHLNACQRSREPNGRSVDAGVPREDPSTGRAALVRDQQVGRQRCYYLTAEPLAEVEDWLHPFEHFWRARLRSLADIAEENT
jgi:hypothetical protein